jgi:hypothetical protein
MAELSNGWSTARARGDGVQRTSYSYDANGSQTTVAMRRSATTLCIDLYASIKRKHAVSRGVRWRRRPPPGRRRLRSRSRGRGERLVSRHCSPHLEQC